MEKIFPYSKQYIDKEDISAVCEALKSPMITRGKRVEEFEATLAKQVRAKYAVAFSSGSSALAGAYYAAKAQPFDTLFTTPNTFVATLSAITPFRSRWKFIDIDYATGNLSLDHLQKEVSQPFSRGKAIITAVHYAGIPLDMEALSKSLKDPETVVIEDAAHALGSLYMDKSPVGSCLYSDMTMFSFHPVKNITTGEGGVITTNKEELYKRLLTYRNNGMVKKPEFQDKAPWYYEISCYSSNYNFTDFQSALGLSQLKKLPRFIGKRQALMQVYRRELSSLSYLSLPPAIYDTLSSWHLCPIKIDFSQVQMDRATLMKQLKEKGIMTQVHYIPMYKILPQYKKKEYYEEQLKQMERFYAQELSFPLYYELEEKEVVEICQSLKSILEKVLTCPSPK